jgi:PAS domain S-box-containing protein
VTTSRPKSSSGWQSPAGGGSSSRRDLTLLAAVFAVIVAIESGYLFFVYIPTERHKAVQAARTRLDGVANDRRAALERWVQERLADAHVLEKCCLSPPPGGAPGRESAPWLKAAETHYGYRAAYVVDPDGRTMSPARPTRPFEELFGETGRSALLRAPASVDFYRSTGGPSLIVTTMPFSTMGDSPVPAGVIILVSDPNDWVYPRLRKEPLSGEADEVLLVRREAPATVLSPLRGPPQEQSFFSVTKPVRNTPWLLVARVSQADVFLPVNAAAWAVALSIAVMTAALTITALAFIRSRRARYLASLSRSEARAVHLFEYANDAILLAWPDGTLVAANRRAEMLYGYPRAELLKFTVRELRPPEARWTVNEHLHEIMGPDGYLYETVIRRKDDTRIPVEVSARSLTIEGEVLIVAIIRDIRDRKQAEAALRNSEARFATLIENAPVGIVMSRDSDVIYANKAYLELFGLESIDEARRGTIENHWTRRTGTESDEERGAGPSQFEAVGRRRDGSLFPLEGAAAPGVHFTDGPASMVFLIDVTERKVARDALRESEEQYRRLFDQMISGLAVFDVIFDTEGQPVDYRLVQANPAFEPLTGLTVSERIGKRGAECGVTWPPELLARMYEVAVTGESIQYECFHEALGHYYDTRVFAPRIGQFAHVFTAVDERKDAEEALRTSEQRFRLAAEATGVFVCEFDPSGRITYCSSAVEKILGYRPEELAGVKSFLDLLAPSARETLGARWLHRMSCREPLFELAAPMVTRSGKAVTIEISAAPRIENGNLAGYVGTVADVTMRRDLETQLRHSQKMEAIGSLAAGVAHDFNNLLQVVTTEASLLRMVAGDPDRVRRIAKSLSDGTRRGASLTRQMLLFAHKETIKFEQLDLNECVREAAGMLRRLVKANIEFAVKLADGELSIEGDRGQIDQVLMNLVVNASDAMPQGGRLTIRTEHADGRFPRLTVQDTGSGIPAAIRDRIFEPFFTTKGVGHGTGLGLSVVHGIVEQHGANIEVESSEGKGTTFRLTFPQGGERRAAPAAASSELQPGHGERILLVEDSEGPRVGLEEMLTTLGYEVVSAGSAEEVSTLQPGQEFDAMLVDVMLPDVGGPELARRLKWKHPQMKVIFMSGYTADEALRQNISQGDVRFLQKPFDMQSLATELSQALASRVA